MVHMQKTITSLDSKWSAQNFSRELKCYCFYDLCMHHTQSYQADYTFHTQKFLENWKNKLFIPKVLNSKKITQTLGTISTL